MWYAIRTVYHWGWQSDGTSVFEERVVALEADSEETAFNKGSAEATQYSKHRHDCEYDFHPEQIVYRLDEGSYTAGCELWSEMFEAKLTLEEFYRARYSAFEYHPE